MCPEVLLMGCTAVLGFPLALFSGALGLHQVLDVLSAEFHDFFWVYPSFHWNIPSNTFPYFREAQRHFYYQYTDYEIFSCSRS